MELPKCPFSPPPPPFLLLFCAISPSFDISAIRDMKLPERKEWDWIKVFFRKIFAIVKFPRKQGTKNASSPLIFWQSWLWRRLRRPRGIDAAALTQGMKKLFFINCLRNFFYQCQAIILSRRKKSSLKSVNPLSISHKKKPERLEPREVPGGGRLQGPKLHFRADDQNEDEDQRPCKNLE